MATAPTRSTAELVMDVADDLRLLVRKEFELARIELIDGIKAQLIGAGLIALAAIGLLPALLFFLFALTFWLPLPLALSFLVVGLGLLAFAAAGIAIGAGVMRRRRPKLEQTVASVKEDVRWVREQLTS